MQVNFLNNQYSPKFGMRFADSEALSNIAQYAVEKGKFEQLNKARLEIDKVYLRHKLKVDLDVNEKGLPVVIFTKYTPKSHITLPQYESDYTTKKITFTSPKKQNTFDYAIYLINKMSHNKCKNEIFEEIIRK